jgi:hypothetical protein
MEDFETFLRNDQLGYMLSDIQTGHAMGFLADAEIVHNEQVDHRIHQVQGDFTDLVENAAALNGIRKAIMENHRGVIDRIMKVRDNLELQGYSSKGAYRSIIAMVVEDEAEK